MATPFSAAAHAGTIAMLVFSAGDSWAWAVAWWCAMAIYGGCAVFFRHPAWLYPGIGSALVAYVATAYFLVPELAFREAMASLVSPTWLLWWAAFAIARLRASPESTPGTSPWGAIRAWSDRWAAPMLLYGLAAMGLSLAGSVIEPGAGLFVALSYAVLLLALAFLWQGQVEAWMTMAVAGLAFWEGLRFNGIGPTDQPPYWAVAALVMTILAYFIQRQRWESLKLWHRPLFLSALVVSAVAAVAAVGVELALQSDPALRALAATAGATGLTLLAHGYSQRQRILGYLGVALVELGFSLLLVLLDVGQPQAFVLPVGAYLMAVAYLEWRRGTGGGIKGALEAGALALLLGTSLFQAVVQAVGFLTEGRGRYDYCLFLFFESLAVFGLGAALRWRRTFFGGMVALVADVLIILADPVSRTDRWYLMAIVGIVMIGVVVFIERQRERIPVWVEEWRERLETWD